MTLIWFSMYFCRLASRDRLAASLFFCRFMTYVWSYCCCPDDNRWSSLLLLLLLDRLIFSKFLGGPKLSMYRCRNDRKSDCLYIAATSSGSTTSRSSMSHALMRWRCSRSRSRCCCCCCWWWRLLKWWWSSAVVVQVVVDSGDGQSDRLALMSMPPPITLPSSILS